MTVVAAAISGSGLRALLGVIIAGVLTLLALEGQPKLSIGRSPPFRRWALSVSAVGLTTVWVTYAFIATMANSETVVDDARGVGVCVVMLASLSIIAFTHFRWWWLVAVSIATGVVFGAPSGTEPGIAAVTLALGTFFVATTALTIWGLQIVEDLEHAKDLGAELTLAEERLRFARDLHDVVGRNFSAIAVKSELASALSRAGAADRATSEIDDVKTLAVNSMAEMRQLIRGYRDIDLENEVAGARSLLSTLGCTLAVTGDPTRVPTHSHELAAWVVREGTTNIVRHASARSATLTFGRAGMSLRNDGATGTPSERSGLLGLAARLAAGGATLDTIASGDQFVLEIHWENL